jgi:hypothetical protein
MRTRSQTRAACHQPSVESFADLATEANRVWHDLHRSKQVWARSSAALRPTVDRAAMMVALQTNWEEISTPPFLLKSGLPGIEHCLVLRHRDIGEDIDLTSARLPATGDIGYHGSAMHNWSHIVVDDIIRPGDRNDGTEQNGHLYGKGVYVSNELREAWPYSRGPPGEPRGIRCIALIRGDFSPTRKHCTDGYKRGVVRVARQGKTVPLFLMIFSQVGADISSPS